MFSSWNVFANWMRPSKLSTRLSSLSDLGQPTQSEPGTDGSEPNSQKSGGPVFYFWLNQVRYRRWLGLPSQLNRIKRMDGYKMWALVIQQSRRQ